MKNYDIVIIGGGIAGIYSMYNLKKKYPKLKVLLLEKENQIAKHQSSRNSGVMHAGLYYKPGSLKSKLCRDGINLMKSY